MTQLGKGFDFNEYQRTIPFQGNGYKFRVMPSIKCADGFRFSVQASETHYCSPRANEEPYYSEVEVGYPSAREESLMPYAESPENPSGTVYGYVPVDVVEAIVYSHGGITINRSRE